MKHVLAVGVSLKTYVVPGRNCRAGKNVVCTVVVDDGGVLESGNITTITLRVDEWRARGPCEAAWEGRKDARGGGYQEDQEAKHVNVLAGPSDTRSIMIYQCGLE